MRLPRNVSGVVTVVVLLLLPRLGQAQVCGDGAIAPTEGCDDGNTVAGDGCNGSCVVEAGFACVPSLHASGVSPAGAVLPSGSTDPHWTWSLSMDRSGETAGHVARNPAWASLPPGNWITTDPTFGAALTTQPDTFWFQDVFMPASFAGTLSFDVAVAADNEAEVFVNGVSFGTVIGFGVAGTRVVPASAFRAGVNTVMIRLREYGPGSPRGILMYPGGGGILSQCTRVCGAPAECDDANECTDDSCVAGACLHASQPAGTTCSVGVCSAAAPVSTCGCSSVADCDDASECTTDACTASGCTHMALMNGTTCSVGLCDTGACVTRCGDAVVAAGLEECDDGNATDMDGCSSTCTVDAGWACGCGTPVITSTMETLAGFVGGSGGGARPDQGCTGTDVLIGLAMEWGTPPGRPEAVRTTTICGAVSVAADGSVTTTPTTRQTAGGEAGVNPACSDWTPTMTSPDVVCPSGSAIVGIHGSQSDLGGTPTLFRSLSIDCQQIGANGTPFGPITNLPIPGGGTGGVAQDVPCPSGAIARFFRTRAGCAQDGLELYCGVVTVECGGSGSICATLCGDGAVGAPVEACDDGGESATCDVDCTPVSCGDGTTNTAAGETCDGAGETAACDDDCTDATCGDGTQNLTAGESCDDGNTTDGDGCSSSCVSESCGDGTVQGTEACDDGGESATCDDDCTPATCGDMRVNATASETCDAGGESAACDDDCTAPECGDGNLNAAAGEACDDDNTTPGDGCSATCAVEMIDGGRPDAGTDAGPPDAGAADAGIDGGTIEFGVSGGACGCRVQRTGGSGGVGGLVLLLALLLVRRARRDGGAS